MARSRWLVGGLYQASRPGAAGRFGSGTDPGRAVVQAGNVVKVLARRACTKASRASWAISSSVSRQSLVKPGHTTSTARAALGQRHQGGFGIGLQPLACQSATGRSWPASPADQALSRRAVLRLCSGRVAQVQGAFGHAVKAHHQLVGLAVFFQCASMRRARASM